MPRNPTKDEVTQFMSMTNCPDKKFVKDHLKKHNNNIQNAVNEYFDQNLGSKYGPKPGDVNTLFDKYKGIKNKFPSRKKKENFFKKNSSIKKNKII